jgi:serine/threonine protein kinase
MSLAPGSRLGSYEILSPLGAGGMGEVWRARDTKLGREVAIKVLPEEVAQDRERLLRFRREAQVLAALNHPHIAAIYGLEESGERALVLELVEGETLAERIAAGPLPVDEALTVCRQLAEALEAAHEKGIIHRDLKPANIKITPAGKVKVLDFGLAKAFGAEASPAKDVSHSPTVTSGGTQKGVILGTAAYMSPEQARGKVVDRRTDIWSFGCVLYEALTGRKAFEGETVSDVMAAVLTREPDWSALPAGLSPRVRQVLRRCLQKVPEKRLHDIADGRLELEELEPEGPPAPTPSSPARRGVSVGALVAAAAAAALLASFLTWLLARRSAAPSGPAVSKLTRITRGSRSFGPAWSPDGSLLAYSSDRNGNFEIYVRRGEGGQDVDVTNDRGQDYQPAFSPDGNTIAFISTRSSRTGMIRVGGTLTRSVRNYGGDLWIVPTLGGGARRLAPNANSPVWRPDGQSILYVSGPENHRSILQVRAEGGEVRGVLPTQDSVYEITRIGCSRDGKWVSFETQLEGIYLMPAAGGKPRLLGSGMSHAWADASDRLYFLSRDPRGVTRLQLAALDPRGGAFVGEPKTITLSTSSWWEIAVTRDGSRVAVAEEESSRNLTRLALEAGGGRPVGAEEPLSSGRVTDDYPAVSPDGRRVAYVSDMLGQPEPWILDLASRRLERVQLPAEGIQAAVSPTWMPDGKQILIARLKRGVVGNWLVSLDGSHEEELFSRGGFEGTGWTVTPSPDGRRLVFPEFVEGVQQVVLYDMATRKVSPLTATVGDKYDALWSPDGREVAFTAMKDGVIQLFAMPASGGSARQLTTGFERMRHPFYSPDGKWIYIQPSHRNIFRVPAAGGSLEPVTRFPDAGLFIEEPSISPDGRYIYYCRQNGASSLWLLTVS